MELDSTPDMGTGLTVDDAAAQLEALLGGSADSEGDETEGEAPQASEDDDAESADTDEEQSEEDEQPEEEAPEPATFTVKVDGEDVTVTQDELLRGYSRTQDYTRKTQALAEKAKALDAERADFAPLAERTKVLLTQLEQTLQAPMYDEEELAALRHSDPAEYAARVAEMSTREKQLSAVTAEKQRLDAETAKAEAGKRAEAIKATEAKLLEARPEWSDPAKLQESFAAIQRVAADIGLTAEEMSELTLDARSILVLDEAAKYRAMVAKKAVTRERIEAVKPAKPGSATQAPSKVTDVTRAKQRLAKTGRVDDAALAIERMLR